MTFSVTNVRFQPGHVPKALREMPPITTTVDYEPACLPKLKSSLKVTQDIRVYTERPLFIMSPGIEVYRKRSIVDVKGYLDKFEPSQCKETGEPTMEITLRVEEVVHLG